MLHRLWIGQWRVNQIDKMKHNKEKLWLLEMYMGVRIERGKWFTWGDYGILDGDTWCRECHQIPELELDRVIGWNFAELFFAEGEGVFWVQKGKE